MNHTDWAKEQDEASVIVDGQDLTVAYYEDGVDNDGPAVVLLHGIRRGHFCGGTSSRRWLKTDT